MAIFAFAGTDILLADSGGVAGPPLGSAVGDGLLVGIEARARRRFRWKGAWVEAWSLDESGASEAERRGLRRMPFRQALSLLVDDELRPALKGLALLNWLEGARFCGACGEALVDMAPRLPAEESIGRSCPACGRDHFPRISPAVIVLVENEGRILLARNARFPATRFGLLAGFVEAGETLEETALREVREEAGIEIGELRYDSSQPWPFPDSLMVAFRASWKAGEARPDGEEILELRWCGPDELPSIPPPGSVARKLIDAFIAERSKFPVDATIPGSGPS